MNGINNMTIASDTCATLSKSRHGILLLLPSPSGPRSKINNNNNRENNGEKKLRCNDMAGTLTLFALAEKFWASAIDFWASAIFGRTYLGEFLGRVTCVGVLYE